MDRAISRDRVDPAHLQLLLHNCTSGATVTQTTTERLSGRAVRTNEGGQRRDLQFPGFPDLTSRGTVGTDRRRDARYPEMFRGRFRFVEG